MNERTAIASAIESSDGFRGPPWPVLPATGSAFKEWLHFCVRTPEYDLLVNFSLTDHPRPSRPGEVLGRVLLVAWGERYEGDLEQVEPGETVFRRGRVDIRLGQSWLRFRDGAYELHVALCDRPISLSLRLEPLTMPSLLHNMRAGPRSTMHWLLVPRMRAQGVLRVGGREYAIADAPAYHDHNWGNFAWGDDFAWEWGYVLAQDFDNPWTVVCTRLLNRARTRCLMQELLLWRGAKQERSFRAHELSVEQHGHFTVRPVFTVPRVMSLLVSEHAGDVPASTRVEARAGLDRLTLDIEIDALWRLVLPNDHDDGLTIIHESTGDVELRGSLRGEPIELLGRGVFEFLAGEA